MRTRREFPILAFLAVVLLGSPALAANLSTGVDSSGNALAGGVSDPEWNIDGADATTRDPDSGWVNDNGTSKWLSMTGGATVVFSVTFYVPPGSTSSAEIVGRMAVDGTINDISINGSGQTVPSGLQNTSGSQWHSVSFTSSGAFIDGTNTLTVEVIGDGSPDGFRAELDTPFGTTSYTFDPLCAPESTHATGPLNPNVYMALDQSGSMTTDVSGTSTSRWDVAETAIQEVTDDFHRTGDCDSAGDSGCDVVRFGLGFFDDGRNQVTEPADDTSQTIQDAIANTGPSGGTQTHQATELLKNSSELATTDRPQLGMIITDGTPDDKTTTRTAVNNICDIRGRSNPVVTYMVGFGSGSNQRVNSFLAAAGGTGTCCKNASYPCASTYEVDPCQMTQTELEYAVQDTGSDDSTYIHTDYDCSGSIEAGDGQALKDAMLEIAGNASCTFQLDIPSDYPAGSSADSDPNATRVQMSHKVYGLIDIPFCDVPNGDSSCGLDQTTGDSAYADEGWFWADSTRTNVRLTDALCGDIGSNDVYEVTTQVACLCQFTGDCIIEKDGFTNEQLENMRCAQGKWVCDGGTDVCKTDFSEMPEICNGVDDDCDGKVDNMKESWAKSQFQTSTYDLPSDHQGVACRAANVCTCADGGADPVAGVTVDEYWDSWAGACMCGEGLGPDTRPEDEDNPYHEPAAACASTSVDPVAIPAWLVLGLAGLVAVRRRWPRR